jgi:biopolymer transport protein ExbD
VADRRGFRLAAFLAFSLAFAGASHAEDADRLTVMIRDGEVLFHGVELDVDQLQSQLTASGLQGSRIYLRLGSGAKSVYIDRVVKAIRSAGFTDIVLLGPSGMEKALDPPV